MRHGEARLVVLDRDGTINRESSDYVKSATEWRALPGSLEAIAALCHAGWTVTVATNQSGIGRDLFSVTDLHAMHARMARELAALGGEISGVFFCPHTPDDHCDCRKPLPGMLHAIADRFGVSLGDVPVIGDSQRDMHAAIAAGARPMLVRTGNGELALRHFKAGEVEVYDDLAAAAAVLLAE